MRQVQIPSTRFHEGGEVIVGSWSLPGLLHIPRDAAGLVIFAHGSGSSRLSPRNQQVARALNGTGIATLLFDLLRPQEEEAQNRAKVFDIPLLAGRLCDAAGWVDRTLEMGDLPLGFFGASTGSAAALTAAAHLGQRVGAVVSRGGRPDLAGEALQRVHSPTLLIVGGADHGVIELNQYALERIEAPASLEIIPGATHLFPEPGAMEAVIRLASNWFDRYLTSRRTR